MLNLNALYLNSPTVVYNSQVGATAMMILLKQRISIWAGVAKLQYFWAVTTTNTYRFYCLFAAYHRSVCSWNDSIQLSRSEKLIGREIRPIIWTPNVHYHLHKACHVSLFWARSVQSILLYSISWRSLLKSSSHLCLGFPSGLFTSCFSTKHLYTSPFPHTSLVPRPSHSS